MSKLKRKAELEAKIDEFVKSITVEIEQICNDMQFVCEEDDEVKARAYYQTEDVQLFQVVRDCVKRITNEKESIVLRFFGDFRLEEKELKRFFEFVDRVKAEYYAISQND